MVPAPGTRASKSVYRHGATAVCTSVYDIFVPKRCWMRAA